MAKCPACQKNHGRLAPGDYRCVCAAEFRVGSNPEIADDRATEVADIFRQTDVAQWLAKAPLDESLAAYIEGTPLEEMHFEYSWRNVDIDIWARSVRKDEAYQEALQENLQMMSRNTGGKVRVFRGHHVNAPIHGSPNVMNTATSLSPTMAIRFRLAAMVEARGGTPLSDWRVSSWEVPIEDVVAHGHSGESELIIRKSALRKLKSITETVEGFTARYIKEAGVNA
jgi:hypothetical protein